MQALLKWVDRVTPPGEELTLQRLVVLAGDADLAREVRELEAALSGGGDTGACKGDRLGRAHEWARHALRLGRAAAVPPPLVPLNPTA